MDAIKSKKSLFPWIPKSYQGRRPTLQELKGFGNNGSICEEPYAHVVGESHLAVCCSNCFQNTSAHMKRCAVCRLIHYCSERCQSRDWKRVHRVECRMLAGCDPEWPVAKVDDYLRLMIRVLIRVRKDNGIPECAGNWNPTCCLRDIPPRKCIYFRHAHNLGRYQAFREAIRHLGNIETLLGEVAEAWITEPDLVTLFSSVCGGAFAVLSFSPRKHGCQQLGLGLYFNFAAFPHERFPDLALSFEPGLNGPVISGRLLKGESVARPLHTLTVVRSEVPYDLFGTNFLSIEEADQYVSLAHGVPNLKIGFVEDLYYGSQLSEKCPSCGENDHVIAGVCSCDFSDAIGNGLLSADAFAAGVCPDPPMGQCRVCLQFPDIPRCDRAFCLNPDCSLMVFRYKPRFVGHTIDPDGPPAIHQVLGQRLRDADQANDDWATVAIRAEASEGSNILVARLLESEWWRQPHLLALGLAMNSNKVTTPRSFIQFAEARIIRHYAEYLPESSYARIAWLWHMVEMTELLLMVEECDKTRSSLKKFLVDKSKHFERLIAEWIKQRVGANTVAGKTWMHRLERLRADLRDNYRCLSTTLSGGGKLEWRKVVSILDRPF